MALFDSVIDTAKQVFGLGDESAGGLLSALLEFLTDPERGGFAGFIDRFRNAGLGDKVNSWISGGENVELTSEEAEAALGAGTIASIAERAGIGRDAASGALAAIIPNVVSDLTPDGEMPDEEGILSRTGKYLSDKGLAVAGAIGAAGAFASETAADTAGAVVDTGRDILDKGSDLAGRTADAVSERTSHVLHSVSDELDAAKDGAGSVLKWLLPLLLLGLLLVLGYWFCGRPSAPVNTGVNSRNANVAANANKTNANVNTGASTAAKQIDPSLNIKAENGSYVITGTVPDEATKKQIVDAIGSQYGVMNVNFDGLKVDANARPFAAGWWDSFSKLLPDLKDWKTGSLTFAGNAITEAVGLPAAAIDRVKALFGSWRLPVSLAGADTAAKQANEEAVKNLESAASIDDVVGALNLSIINFASGKSDIPADARPILVKAAEVLKKYSDNVNVEIGGHTDTDGDDAANMKLSQERAEAVKKALIDLGVPEAKLTAKGYGETVPKAPNDTPDNKFQNRRIEYKNASK